MIKIIKLTTGEELVAKVSTSGSKVKIEKPFILQMAPNNSPEGGGQMGLALFPYAPYVKDHTIEVGADNIVWQQVAHEGMETDYQRAKDNLEVRATAVQDDITKAISEAFPKK